MDCSCPPSPAESDKVSKRFSWSRVMEKLTEFNHLYKTPTTPNSCNRRYSGTISEASSEHNLFYDPSEDNLCAEVVDTISQSLHDTEASVLGCSKLLIPEQLLEHIGQELLHLAVGEPCGLRGALLDLYLEHKETLQCVEQIVIDPCLVPTFQLTLVLRPELGGLWRRFTHSLSNSLRLSTGFKVIKKKLYSSGELFVKEF